MAALTWPSQRLSGHGSQKFRPSPFRRFFPRVRRINRAERDEVTGEAKGVLRKRRVSGVAIMGCPTRFNV
jgi:hypothetical protein